jgi:glycosyltransferase involved in cell wall biosynthesis
MKHSVLLLTRYGRLGPSSRVRHYNYIPALEQAGFDVTIAPLLDDDYLHRFYGGKPRNLTALVKAYWRRVRQLLTAKHYDLIWVEKEALPWSPALFERGFFGKQPVIIDFDDAWYVRYAKHPSWVVRSVLGRKFENIVSTATAVTTGSGALKSWAERSSASRVAYIPSAINLDRYPLLPLPDRPFTIGWIGTPTSARYLALIADPLRYMQDVWGARVRVIGADRLRLPGLRIDHVPWREDTEGLELAACHVGVMPLGEGPWERGKCGYKVIQYMAAGRPTVASPIGANRSIIAHGQTGLLASNLEEWLSALSSLAADRDKLIKLGLAARDRAESMYSLQSNAQTLISVFRDVLHARHVQSQKKPFENTSEEVLPKPLADSSYGVSLSFVKPNSAERHS